MRIAFVATGGFDRSGRVNVIPALLGLVARLARENTVVVYVLRYHDEPCCYPLQGATICDLGRPDGLWNQYRAVRAAIERDGPFDVIHGYWAVPAGLVAAVAGRRLGIPSIVTCDSGEFVALKSINYGQQLRTRSRLAVAAATRLATCVTVCTTFQAQLASQNGIKAHVVPIGVDRQIFTPARRPRAHMPPFKLLHVASLNPVKGQAVLLDALSTLVRGGLDVTLDVVGEDTMGGSLHATAERLGLSDRVRFLGFQSSHALVSLYHSAHLFVLSSLHEAAGVVLLEAAACGTPVVGSAVGFLADWSPDAALSVRTNDSRALATAIGALLTDPQRSQSLASRAHAFAVEHDADWTAVTFQTLYAELGRASRRRRRLKRDLS